MTNGDVVAILRPRARIIYLKVKPETALKRMGASRTSRPLLFGPIRWASFDRLLVERGSAYERADEVIDTERIDGATGYQRKSSRLLRGAGRHRLKPFVAASGTLHLIIRCRCARFDVARRRSVVTAGSPSTTACQSSPDSTAISE